MVPGKVSARRLLAASAAVALALGVSLAPRDAHALGGEVGAFGGPLIRTSTELGKTYGAFIGIRPSNQLGLYFDVFYNHQEFDLSKRTPEGGHRYPDIDVIGGRFRYLIDATKRLKPYAHIGLAYAHISYPGLITPVSENLSSGRPQTVIARGGRFAELPVGLGLAIEVAKALRVNVEGSYRAGFAFAGAAYEDGALPAEKKVSSGASLTGGVSLFFLSPVSVLLDRRMRRALCLSIAMATSLAASRDARADRPPYQLEMGPTAGVVNRGTKQNPDKIAYEAAFAYGLQLRVRAASWLRVSARYQVAYHDVELPPFALGTGASRIVTDPARTNSLAALFHPTWSPVERLHVMGAFGVGWTKIDISPLELDPPIGANIRNRGGVLVETPIGISASVDIIRGWMSAGYDGTYSPAFLQTGGMYETDPYVSKQGYSAAAAPMPRISYTVTNLVWLAVNL